MAGICNDCGRSTWGRYRICPECRKERKGRIRYSSNKNSNRTNNYNKNLIFFIGIFFLGYLIYNYNIKGIYLSIFGSTIIILMAFYFYFKSRTSNKKKYFCNNCHYCWKSRKIFGIPSRCPKCRNRNITNYIETDIGKGHMKKAKITFAIVAIILIFLIIFSNTPKLNKNYIIPVSYQDTNQKTISPEQQLINSCITKFSNEGIYNLKNTIYQNNFSSASNWIRNNYENSALTPEQKEHNINYILGNKLPKERYPLVITYASKNNRQITSQDFYYCDENGII